jgi:hypothetical protein
MFATTYLTHIEPLSKRVGKERERERERGNLLKKFQRFGDPKFISQTFFYLSPKLFTIIFLSEYCEVDIH